MKRLETLARRTLSLWGVMATLAMPALAQPTSADALLTAYTAQAGAPASAERGQALFNKSFGRDFDSCASCHGAVPTKPGKDLASEKAIAPLAPAAHASRFNDKARVEHRFRVNCRDVIGRECSAGEKADLLAWLISLKP
jgi:mono/diheme cytochrome c family protein